MPNHALIILTGHLGKDPEQRMTQDGKAITNFSLAVKTGYGDRAISTWYNCAAFGKTAEVAAKYLKKGNAVNIIGTPSLREYTTKDGGKGQSLDVAISELVLLEAKADAAPAKAATGSPFADDTIPF